MRWLESIAAGLVSGRRRLRYLRFRRLQFPGDEGVLCHAPPAFSPLGLVVPAKLSSQFR
ncbi:hypothetical protein F2Q69_00004812 [Brassica cretica]|uniref:Uncharacterized protein n=1 Tax=Brassica cretica TaxID=69181 RepID=A0A8S9NVW2_BRACR|nr:hypothetical protein F2Q69_00004812 [Brassica cretica]